MTLGLLVLAELRVPAPADAVGTADPVITSPTVGSALYDGFTGPFVVRFDDAPIATYQYAVVADPAGAATVVRGPVSYAWEGDSGDHQFSVAALRPGSYRFTISDVETHTHQASLDFTIRSGTAPKCSLVVPTRVRVHAPLASVPGVLSRTCSQLNTETAAWKVVRAWQTYDYFTFHEDKSSDSWSVYDSDPIGAYAIVPLGAKTFDFADVPQNSPTAVVRRDSRLVLGGWRSGGDVTLLTSLKFYSASRNAFRPWAGKYVSLAYRTCGSCTWHHLRTLTTDSHGEAVAHVHVSGVREYRVAASGTSQVWEPLRRYKRL